MPIVPDNPWATTANLAGLGPRRLGSAKDWDAPKAVPYILGRSAMGPSPAEGSGPSACSAVAPLAQCSECHPGSRATPAPTPWACIALALRWAKVCPLFWLQGADGKLVNRVVMNLFRARVVDTLGKITSMGLLRVGKLVFSALA